MKAIKKLTGRFQYYIAIGCVFRGFRIGLTFDNPFAVCKELFLFELIFINITIWAVYREKLPQ